MTEQTQNNKPINFRDSPYQVTVWTREGQHGNFYDIETTRSYKDKNDQWQKAHLVADNDLHRVQRLQDKAYERVQELRMQDRKAQGYQQAHDAASQQPDAQQTPEMDTAGLQQARDEAMANVPEQRPQQPQRDMSREP